MPSMFERRFNERSVPMLNRTFGVEVVVINGVRTSEPFTARRDVAAHTSIGAKYGIEVKVVMRDFYLPVSAVAFDGVAVEPKRLFQVCEVETGETFEVQSPNDSTLAVELLPGGFEWLVHTKKLDMEV